VINYPELYKKLTDLEAVQWGIDEMSKGQNVRLLDVFFIGPIGLWIAFQRGPLSGLQKNLMYLIGAGTIVYNLNNYFQNKKLYNLLLIKKAHL